MKPCSCSGAMFSATCLFPASASLIAPLTSLSVPISCLVAGGALGGGVVFSLSFVAITSLLLLIGSYVCPSRLEIGRGLGIAREPRFCLRPFGADCGLIDPIGSGAYLFVRHRSSTAGP